MFRSRLVWFSLGFSVSAAAISQFVWKDLLVDRYALSSDMKNKFDALEQRVQNLESVAYQNSNPSGGWE
ncbi:fanconi anemia group D2 protein [Parasponia andersonii]|uniref:Fanconi anemia group D2 protein n=1 Tax=Parasponia andersonii TaxID=3476 RepID=A0A2P5B189_PARAD|nr:fanconi anemia group D2 protein [Parasponia andersonii]